MFLVYKLGVRGRLNYVELRPDLGTLSDTGTLHGHRLFDLRVAYCPATITGCIAFAVWNKSGEARPMTVSALSNGTPPRDSC